MRITHRRIENSPLCELLRQNEAPFEQNSHCSSLKSQQICSILVGKDRTFVGLNQVYT